MVKYDIVAVLWEDHIQFSRTSIIRKPDESIIPSLSVGILIKETPKTLTIVSNIERYQDHDDADYIIVLKSTVLSVKKYGEIELIKFRK